MTASLSAFVICEADGTEYEGSWPAPDEGEEQDQAEAPSAVQTCPACGNVQNEIYPKWSFHQEAG